MKEEKGRWGMEFHLPELGEGVYEAEAVRWLVPEGSTVRPGQPLIEMLTDKATMEVPSPFSGTIERFTIQPGEKVKVGQTILNYGSAATTTKVEPAPAKTDDVVTSSPRSHQSSKADPGPKPSVPPRAAPSVRLLARKLGVDLASLHGSGPEGRILVEDLTPSLVHTNGAPRAKPVEAVDFGVAGTRIKLAGLRRKIAEQMALAKRSIPHFTYVDEVDVSELVHLRASLNESKWSEGTRITYLPFIVRAVVRVLKEMPIVNASLDEDAGEIVYHDRYHVGIAVATSAGLIVPVVHDADQKDFFTVAKEIERLARDAKAGKSKLEDLKGGTFTLTSIGNIGGLFSTPIIPPGQVGILGIGKIVKRPVFDERMNVRPADMVYLSFSFDHRIVDGAVGTEFGNRILRQLRDPWSLVLG